MDLETAERELNAFIEKRAKGRQTANAAEESWKAPTRQRRQQIRRDNARAWADHFESMALVHHDLAARFAARADALREQLDKGSKHAETP